MRAVLAAHGVTDRCVWVADSFQGLPEPDGERFPVEARAHASKTVASDYKHFAVSRRDVEANFTAFGLLDNQVRFLEGWFKDTLPKAPIERLAVIRLGGDYYQSTMDALTSLYDKLSPGGYVIVDDYGARLWTYCRKAIEDFRRERGIVDELRRVDSKCYDWQRCALGVGRDDLARHFGQGVRVHGPVGLLRRDRHPLFLPDPHSDHGALELHDDLARPA